MLNIKYPIKPLKEKTVEELQKEIVRLKKELKSKKKYGLVWEEKSEDVVEMCKEKLPILKEVNDKEMVKGKIKRSKGNFEDVDMSNELCDGGG